MKIFREAGRIATCHETWRAGYGVTAVWTAPTCRSFPTGRHVGQWESGDMSPQSEHIGFTGEFERDRHCVT